LAVSIFFTIWQLTDDHIWKSRGTNQFEEIDRRYITLLAAILEARTQTNIQIKKNIRFVTWNYDLQLEYAFKSFSHDQLSWDHIFRNLSFRPKDGTSRPLEICHLNGYHGFYLTENKEQHFLDLTTSQDVKEIVNELSFIQTSQTHQQLNLTNHINYAWESNEIAFETREEAKRIFSETDILIIVGYSFPNFNKEIDVQLFDQLKGRKTKLYYQDPNASISFISQLVDTNECEVICQPDKLDTFILPYKI
jgi:hypothetical protein